jgi:methionyl-tRNA formyltransferase
LHGSFLPKYRGAAPIQWAVAMGETVTGNTTMLLEEGLDTGPILMQQSIAIKPEQNSVDLFAVLSQSGAPLVVETIAGLANGTLQPQPQDHAKATLAPLLDREDGRMDFITRTATELKNRWRGFQPWPGAFTALDGKKLLVHRMEVATAVSPAAVPTEPARIVIENHRVYVTCAHNTLLELIELQLEGKKRMLSADFLRGVTIAPDTRLG